MTPCKGWPSIKQTYFRAGLDFIKHESVRPTLYFTRGQSSARGQSLIKRDIPRIGVRLVKYIYCKVPRPCYWGSLILDVLLPEGPLKHVYSPHRIIHLQGILDKFVPSSDALRIIRWSSFESPLIGTIVKAWDPPCLRIPLESTSDADRKS